MYACVGCERCIQQDDEHALECTFLLLAENQISRSIFKIKIFKKK